jgi:hypothetical protein
VRWLSLVLLLACSSDPDARVTIAASGEVGPPRPLQPQLFPHWQRTDGRARVVMALAAPQWDVEVQDGACFVAQPKSGDARVHVEWQDAKHARVVSYGHGSVTLGECARAKEWAVATDAVPLDLGVLDARDEVKAVPAPVGADAVRVYRTDAGPLVVAAPGAVGGAAFVYVNDAWNDHDGDGLGAQLEADLGTLDSAFDTDEDAIDDGMETMGYQAGSDPPQLLPAWGASPTHKDLFVEVDWEDDGGASIGFVDGPGVIQPTADHFAHLRADSIHNPDGLPGVSLHVDNGVPSSGTTWGDWGGFTIIPIQPANTPDAAEAWGIQHTFMQSRIGVFHYALTYTRLAGGAWGYYPGTQVMTHRMSQSAFQEELGHNVGLAHHGGGRGINCKPNYDSHMNYAFNGEFSDGRFINAVLNPTHLDETISLGTGNAASVAFLAGPPFFYTIRADGAIDWNRDGRFDTNVRAWINYPAYFGFSCENARYRIDGWGGGMGKMDSLRGALGRDADRLVVFYGMNGQLVWRQMTAWLNCDDNNIANGCGNWTAPQQEPIMLSGGISAASFGGQLHVVALSGGKLEHYVLGASSLSHVDTVPSSGGTTADPGLAATTDALVLLYADAQGQLIEQRWQGTTWSGPQIAAGITVDRDTGAQPAFDGTNLRAAIVSSGAVTILDRDASGWHVDSGAFVGDRRQSDRAPALAWGDGRWYLMFRGVGATHVMLMDMTDASGRFNLLALQDNIWAAAPAAPGLFFDPNGGNLRMVKPGLTNEILIWPYADGIFDVDMHDVDDASIIRPGLCWALKGCGDPSCPPSPPLINACGGTQPSMVLDWIDDLPQDLPY